MYEIISELLADLHSIFGGRRRRESNVLVMHILPQQLRKSEREFIADLCQLFGNSVETWSHTENGRLSLHCTIFQFANRLALQRCKDSLFHLHRSRDDMKFGANTAPSAHTRARPQTHTHSRWRSRPSTSGHNTKHSGRTMGAPRGSDREAKSKVKRTHKMRLI